MKVLVQFELLGPKDRKLVAPSVRAGRCDRYLPEHRRCATVCAGPSGLSGYQKMEFPVLTDGATNFRSFGPKACLRLKLHQYSAVSTPAKRALGWTRRLCRNVGFPCATSVFSVSLW